MKNLHELDHCRVRSVQVMRHYGHFGDHENGVFEVRSPIDGADLFIIASSGAGWDHLSISRRKRTPNWPELEFVRKMFGKPDEVWMQFHVPASDHVNDHPYCLHLWRPTDRDVHRPPGWMVGGVSADEAEAEFRKATAG